jgi:hypothetical protein
VFNLSWNGIEEAVITGIKEAFLLPWNEIEETLITGRRKNILSALKKTNPGVVVATNTRI